MLEPHPVWTTLGLVKLLFSDENSRHFYMRFTPGKPPTSAIHFSTLSVYTRSYTQRLEKNPQKSNLPTGGDQMSLPILQQSIQPRSWPSLVLGSVT